MIFDLKKHIVENNNARDKRVVEANKGEIGQDRPYDAKQPNFTVQEKQVLKQLKSAGGARGKHTRKQSPGVSAQFVWDTKSGDGLSLQFWKNDSRGEYVATLWKMEDGEPTGQLQDDYRSANFKQAVAKAHQFLRKVK